MDWWVLLAAQGWSGNLCRKILLQVRTLIALWYQVEQAEAVPGACTSGEWAAGTVKRVVDAVLVL